MATKKRESGQEIVRVNAPEGVPDYLAAHIAEDTSLDNLQEYKILPRIKIVQSTANGELLKVFSPGDIILFPGNVMVAPYFKAEQKSEAFLFVPLFFFTEFCMWSDLKDTTSKKIQERTFDAGSSLAIRSKDPNRREEKYGDKSQFTRRYVEHLNFPGIIYAKSQCQGQLSTLSFARGDFQTGLNFITALTMRKMPLWSQVVELNSVYHERGADVKYYGFEHRFQEGEKNITAEEVDFFKKLHNELKDLFAKKLLVVDRTDEEGSPNYSAKNETRM